MFYQCSVGCDQTRHFNSKITIANQEPGPGHVYTGHTNYIQQRTQINSMLNVWHPSTSAPALRDLIVLDRFSFFYRSIIDDAGDSNDRLVVIKLFWTDSRPQLKHPASPDNPLNCEKSRRCRNLLKLVKMRHADTVYISNVLSSVTAPPSLMSM